MRTVYQIKDVYGETIAEHVRVDLPNGKKRMYWQVPEMPESGLYGLSTPDLPLYGSERMGMMQVGRTAIIVEGERATDALRSIYSWVYGTVTGASGTPGEDALAPLISDDVVLWPDYDEPGEQHMARVSASLLRLGGRVRRLGWGRQKGDDAADFVERGGSIATLELLIQAAAPIAAVYLDAESTSKTLRPSYDCHDDTRVTTARSHLLQVVEAKLGPPRKRMGRSLFWCCPFHTERTASFKVDLKEPFYRCFGCEARGDVFTFLRSIEGRAFKDALLELAPPVGLGGIPRFGA